VDITRICTSAPCLHMRGWCTIVVDGLLSMFKPSRIRQRTNLRPDSCPSHRFLQTSRQHSASERHQSNRWARTAARHDGIHRIACTTTSRSFPLNQPTSSRADAGPRALSRCVVAPATIAVGCTIVPVRPRTQRTSNGGICTMEGIRRGGGERFRSSRWRRAQRWLYLGFDLRAAGSGGAPWDRRAGYVSLRSFLFT
jgi:hypothetical protein